MKENAASALTYVPRSAPVVVPRSAPAPKLEKQVAPAPAPAPSPVTDTPAFSSNASDRNTVQELEGTVILPISFLVVQKCNAVSVLIPYILFIGYFSFSTNIRDGDNYLLYLFSSFCYLMCLVVVFFYPFFPFLLLFRYVRNLCSFCLCAETSIFTSLKSLMVGC